MQQVVLASCFIAPIVNTWFGVLGRLQLSMLPATLVDQFLFSPPFTIAIFYFLSAAFGGGVALTAGWRDAQVVEVVGALNLSAFPSLLSYDPVWSTQVKAYWLWLPATLVREAFTPAHLKPLFTSSVAFVWNIVFAFILAAK